MSGKSVSQAEVAKETEERCRPVFFGLVRGGELPDGKPTYLLRCAVCDGPVPWHTYDDENEWQEFRRAVGAKPRRYLPDKDEFVEDAPEEPRVGKSHPPSKCKLCKGTGIMPGWREYAEPIEEIDYEPEEGD